jgi:hypothetical protein
MCSLFNFSGEHSLHSSDVELQLIDVVDDLCRDKSGLLKTINHHSLLPPSGRTFGSRYRNAFIHNSSIHCSS